MVCLRHITMWCSSSSCYMLYLCEDNSTDKSDLSSHCIIKFVGFILIYYAINMVIVSSFMVFSNLYFGYIHLLQV